MKQIRIFYIIKTVQMWINWALLISLTFGHPVLQLLPEIFLIPTFLAKLLVPPTTSKRLMGGKYLLWKHGQGVVTAWHLQVRHGLGNNSVGCADAPGKTRQHTACVSTQVMNSHLHSLISYSRSFFSYCLVGYCSQGQTLVQTTAGSVWRVCRYLLAKLREASWPAVHRAPSDLRSTDDFLLIKWRNTCPCYHPFLNVQVMHFSCFPAVVRKTTML